jgi:hypothetical protein
MVEAHIEADVPESRQITITLPPEVPTGRVRVTITVAEDGTTPPKPLPHYVVPFDPARTECYSGQIRVIRDGDPE